MITKRPTLAKGRYRHYKGNEYQVVDLALHSETEEWVVLYYPLYDDEKTLWVRPYTMFIEKVQIEGKDVPRFERISE
jgi:hypothetical protein